MPDPSISPANVGSTVYTVSNSKGLSADLRLDMVTTTPFPFFQVRYPPSAPGVQVTLRRGGTSLNLLPGPVNDTTTFTNRRIVASASPSGSDTLLTCEIRATASPAPNEAWTVQAGSAAPHTWQFTQVDNTPADPTITRIMCDPVAKFTITAPTLTGSTVREKDTVTLTASPATGPAATPTVVGGPAPSVSYSWTKTGNLAITQFPQCSTSQTMSFNAPGVYGPRTVNIVEQVWFEGGCPSPVGFLNASAPAQALTIDARPQHLALVLDRSGSMTGPRWENAKTAARILAHLFVAMRSSVVVADRIEEIVFEDSSCTWHTPSIDPLIGSVLPLSSVGSADGAICGVKFGPAGTCTPIGDGLIKAIDDLAALGTADDPHFTIVLLTDGYENSGTVVVSPNTPVPVLQPPVQKFSTARQEGTARQGVNNRLSLFTIGLGPTVQEDVLDALAAQSQGVYRHVVDVGQVGQAMADMVAFSHAAQRVSPEPAGATPTTRLVKVDPKVSRLAVAVEWSNATDTIGLGWREQGSGGSFTDISKPGADAAVKKCPTHGFIWVDVASLFGGDESAVPATEWQIVHYDSSAVPQPLPLVDGDLLVFVDLFVRADVVFDREQYRTGDPMVVTARLRAGDDPITKATVTVELARPGESLGTFLATNGAGYQPTQPSPPDPDAPKAQMLKDLLRRHDKGPGLPILTPPSIFEDGSNQLFDDGAHHDEAAGDGNYANRYLELDKEGSYTWRFAVAGELPDGSAFTRVITVSKWVGIRVDPGSSPVTTSVLASPPGLQLTQITVYPKDRNGEFLGPFRPEDVVFKSSSCPFQKLERQTVPEGVVFPQKDGGSMVSRYDGGYTRVVECEQGRSSTITIIVQGQQLKPITTGQPRGCLPSLLTLLLALVRRFRKPSPSA
jgi:Mg-chelatase subunit ChlD